MSKKKGLMFFDNEWLKSALGAAVGGVTTAVAFVTRQDRRITRIEEKTERIDALATTALESRERLVRVEAHMSGVQTSLTRVENKIDGLSRQ